MGAFMEGHLQILDAVSTISYNLGINVRLWDLSCIYGKKNSLSVCLHVKEVYTILIFGLKFEILPDFQARPNLHEHERW